MHDCVITGGKIFDGSGSEGHFGDVAIKDGLISEVSETGGLQGAERIDANGAIVTRLG